MVCFYFAIFKMSVGLAYDSVQIGAAIGIDRVPQVSSSCIGLDFCPFGPR